MTGEATAAAARLPSRAAGSRCSSCSSVDLLTDSAPTWRLMRRVDLRGAPRRCGGRSRRPARGARRAGARAARTRSRAPTGAATAGVVVNAASVRRRRRARRRAAARRRAGWSAGRPRRGGRSTTARGTPRRSRTRSPRSATGSPLGSKHERVVALLLDLDRELLQLRVRRQEDVRHLVLRRRRAADEAPDHLPEEELGARGGRVHADAQARDVDALGDHQHRHEPRRRARREARDPRRGVRRVGVHDVRPLAGDPRQPVGELLRVLLVDRDHQAAGVRVLAGARSCSNCVVRRRAARG